MPALICNLSIPWDQLFLKKLIGLYRDDGLPQLFQLEARSWNKDKGDAIFYYLEGHLQGNQKGRDFFAPLSNGIRGVLLPNPRRCSPLFLVLILYLDDVRTGKQELLHHLPGHNVAGHDGYLGELCANLGKVMYKEVILFFILFKARRT